MSVWCGWDYDSCSIDETQCAFIAERDREHVVMCSNTKQCISSTPDRHHHPWPLRLWPAPIWDVFPWKEVFNAPVTWKWELQVQIFMAARLTLQHKGEREGEGDLPASWLTLVCRALLVEAEWCVNFSNEFSHFVETCPSQCWNITRVIFHLEPMPAHIGSKQLSSQPASLNWIELNWKPLNWVLSLPLSHPVYAQNAQQILQQSAFEPQ